MSSALSNIKVEADSTGPSFSHRNLVEGSPKTEIKSEEDKHVGHFVDQIFAAHEI